MTSSLHALAVSMLVGLICYCTGELTLEAEQLVKTLPVDVGQLNPFTFLLCNIQPANATVITRWILPNGITISEREGRFITEQGDTAAGFSSLLVIAELSYRDAGRYTCEVLPVEQDLCTCQYPPSAFTELCLLVTLSASENEVRVSDNATVAELSCEMKDFIRPDEDLEWFNGDEQLHTGGRLSISFSAGTANAAQMGANSTIHSRLSTLTIESPIISDSGTYSCRIRGANVSADIQLTVSGDNAEQQLDLPNVTLRLPPPPANSPSSATSSSSSSSSSSVASSFLAFTILGTAAIAAVLSSLLSVMLTCLCVRRGLFASKQLGLRSNSSSPTLEWIDLNG